MGDVDTIPIGDRASRGAASPAELLATHVVLTPTQFAYVAGIVYTKGATKGQPDVRTARGLIRSGAVRLVDSTQSPSRWTIAVDEVRRYLAEGSRAGAA